MVAPKSKSGAISKGYSFASTWEQGCIAFCRQNAPLTEQQQVSIIALSHAVAERPFPSNLSQERVPGQENGLSITTQDSVAHDSAAAREAVLVNTNQFYKWFNDLEAAMKSETEEKYKHYVDTLTQRIQTCDGILRQVDDTLELFNELQLQHQAVATKTKTLHGACNRLVMDKQRLIEFADALHSKLNYFDELENIATNFYSPNTSVGSQNFLPLLKRLDECISYIESNPQYAESTVYLVKFQQLQIANYLPFNEDLDYPAKLEQSSDVKEGAQDNDENQDLFRSWYPPLEKTISLLSKLYRCLEPGVFTGLAQEAVEVCSLSIQRASKLILQKSSPMDGQLFLIKHLIREQVAPFDIEFSATHKELDFSHLLEHLRRLLRGHASLFYWSRSSSLARTFSLRVLESQVDAKKELEKILKATCEEFIMSVTKLIVDPLLSFVAKVTAVKVAISSGNSNQKFEAVIAKPLKEQAFATPEKVAELVQKVSSAIQQELPRVIEKMKLYLLNPSTRTILLKPIKTNILEAHTQVIASESRVLDRGR